LNNISIAPGALSRNPNLLLHREVRSVYIGLIDWLKGRLSEKRRSTNKNSIIEGSKIPSNITGNRQPNKAKPSFDNAGSKAKCMNPNARQKP
jgi:hypothetical protein